MFFYSARTPEVAVYFRMQGTVINLLAQNVPFLYPPENVKKPKVF